MVSLSFAMGSGSAKSRVWVGTLLGSRDLNETVVAKRASHPKKDPCAIFSGVLSLRQGLIVTALLTALALPATARTARLDPQDAMVEEFQPFCVNYYTAAQCTGAVRFILKNAGSQYFVQLQFEESGDGFLDLLAKLVKRGEALRANEAAAAKADD